MSMMWVGIGTAVVGAGTSLYGSNKQSQNEKDAIAANKASVAGADQSAWVNYLLTRGVAVDPNTPTGSLPTNGRAVNTKLPLWANMTMPTQQTAARRGGFLKQRV